ncbi:MAG TPA: hypothetical protein VLV82_04345, partial [Candidatus Angelobacter sp.]|nr:hypothetical protein [Candidatus Angelobacter sp.]
MAVSFGPVFATAHDATDGVLALDVPRPGVAYAPVVDLLESPEVLADALDLPWTGAFRHAFCWGLLVPEGSRLLVVVMGRDARDLAGDGVVAGRLSDEDTVRWAPLWGGRPVRVSVLVEATPGLANLEVRFRTTALAGTAFDLGEAAPSDVTAAPAPPVSDDSAAGWAAAMTEPATVDEPVAAEEPVAPDHSAAGWPTPI